MTRFKLNKFKAARGVRALNLNSADLWASAVLEGVVEALSGTNKHCYRCNSFYSLAATLVFMVTGFS